MRRKASLLAVGLLAGATISVTGGSPAHAQPCESPDPALAYVCHTLGNPPPVWDWVNHYYDTAGRVVKTVYCTLWDDPTCP